MSDAGDARILFAVDAAPEVGLGHLVRSIAMATAVRRFDIDALFAVDAYPAVIEKLHAAEIWFADESRDSNGGMDAPAIARIGRRSGCQAVAVDLYRVAAAALGELRALGFFVIALDDLAREPFPCQLVVNGGAQAPAMPYRAAAEDTTFLLGTEYAILREELWEPQARTIDPVVRHVLVSLGGGASSTRIAEVLSALDRVHGDFDVTVIKGPFTDAMSGPTRATLSSSIRRVRVVLNPREMRDLMACADIAVCGGGQTLYELAAVGTPAVAVQLAANQADSLRAVVASGSARLVDGPDMATSLRGAVEELCERTDLRAAMSAAGQRLVDGGGALRVARTIAERMGAR